MVGFFKKLMRKNSHDSISTCGKNHGCALADVCVSTEPQTLRALQAGILADRGALWCWPQTLTSGIKGPLPLCSDHKFSRKETNRTSVNRPCLPCRLFLPVRWHLLVITGELACVPVFHDCVRFLLSFDWGCLLTRESHCGPLERVDAPNQNPATIQILEAVGRWH